MGMMTQILQSEPKKNPAPQKVEKPIQPAEPTGEKTACQICGCPDLWESIYADGVLRCDICEPAPSPAIVGRRIGPAAEISELAEEDDTPLGTDPADRFVEFVTADGRTGLALRGYDSIRGANYNPRVCAYVQIGVARYDKLIDDMQVELRGEIFVEKLSS